MKQNRLFPSAGLLLALALLAACAPSTAQTPTLDPELLITQAAATVEVQLTLNAALTPSPTASATLAPTLPPAPEATAPAVATAPAATVAPAATSTTAPAATVAPAQSDDAASFVEDVTVPDGTGAAPGAQFDKIWRIKNTGKTTWTSAYALVPVDGDRMGAPDSIPMPKEVRPGETVDISVKLTAPAKPGTYQTFFRLRNAAGAFYRLDGTGDLWLKIVVGTGATATPGTSEGTTTPTVTPTPGA